MADMFLKHWFTWVWWYCDYDRFLDGWWRTDMQMMIYLMCTSW